MDRLDGLLLERRERMLLLLIDGRRSVADLVRLTRRDEHEVQAVLEYLLTLGLIE
jgi:predicted transcriptional regulator